MTQTREIFLNVLCTIHVTERVIAHPSNAKRSVIRNCHITSINKKGSYIMWQEQLDKDGYYGFFDKPELQAGTIELSNIALVLYQEPVTLSTHPTLDLYREGDKIFTSVTNHRTGKNEWREAIVLNTGVVHSNSVSRSPSSRNYGERHAPYPYIEVKTMFTYWKGDSQGNGEFYEKENTTRVYSNTDAKFDYERSYIKQ